MLEYSKGEHISYFAFEDMIRKRITQKNKNWLCMIVGEIGSGKSYCALRLAYDIDPNFSINNVVFKTQNLIKKIKKEEIKGGSVLILNEIGVAHPSQRWFSLQTRVFNYILQTFRRENIGLIFTVPDLSFVDIQARKLFHSYIEARKIIYSRNVCDIYLNRIQNDPRSGEICFHPFYVRELPTGVSFFKINKPPTKLCKQYEKKRKQFTEELYNKIENMLKSNVKLSRNTKKDKILREFHKLKQPEINPITVRKIANKVNSTKKYVREIARIYNLNR